VHLNLQQWRNYDHFPAAKTRGIPNLAFDKSALMESSAGKSCWRRFGRNSRVVSGRRLWNRGRRNRRLDILEPDELSQQVVASPRRCAPLESAIVAELGKRSIVLVGMMGAGKSSVGRRLSQRMGIPFVDADAEVEKAAGMTIPEIFATHGEPDFRAGEARVIARLLDGGPQVLATGGGAFMNPSTRAGIAAKGVSVWLNADLDVLLRRIRRRHDRPLLATEDPSSTLRDLIANRAPDYATANVTVHSRDVPHEKIVDEIVSVLAEYLSVTGECGPAPFPEESAP
jgi:shikimate kinase